MSKKYKFDHDETVHKRKWFNAVLCAIVIHCAGVLTFYLLTENNDDVQNHQTLFPFDVNELEQSPKKSLDFRDEEERSRGEEKAKEKGMSPRSVQKRERASPEFGSAGPKEPEGEKESPPPDRIPDLSLESNAMVLIKTASEDPRIRRRLDNPEVTLFKDEPGPLKTNLPLGLPYEEIRRSVENNWHPDWEQIKDGIGEVSEKWVTEEVKNWLVNWQENLEETQKEELPGAKLKDMMVYNRDKELGENKALFPDSKDSMAYLNHSEFAPIRVTLEIDLEPLRNGGYAASIARSSDHPFFDSHALEEVKKIASHFPPWIEGYGHAMRYVLDANFTIVPPNSSMIVGLNCAFPFCNPEELKELEITHWFKKLLTKSVQFKGLIAPPPLPDGGQ